MSQTVTIESKIASTDSINTTRLEFSLPITRLTGLDQYSNSVSTQIAAASVKTFDLTGYGSKLKSLAVKATRPIGIFIITDDKEYELPLSTYCCLRSDTKEDLLTSATAIRLEVPPAALSAPSPAPALYPNAGIDLYFLLKV